MCSYRCPKLFPASSTFFPCFENAIICIDRCPKGNRSRFINHADKPNCRTRIMTVRGDQHIGIFAQKNVQVLQTPTALPNPPPLSPILPHPRPPVPSLLNPLRNPPPEPPF